MPKLKKNLGYQTIYQILNTCLPLITSPYLARVLGAEKQGVFSYTQSIVNYFTLIAMLGVVNYGTRSIASCMGDRKKQSDAFWNIYALQFVVSVISVVSYIIYLLMVCPENVWIAVLQSFYLFGALVDVNWLFFGVEKFRITVTRSMVIRICSVILILFFVKTSADLWIYTAIMAGSTFFSNIILWYFVPQEIEMHPLKMIRVKKIGFHLKPNLVLFIPVLAMSVYHVMDKTMLGLLSTYEQVGYYYNADKIINIPIGVISGVGTVMLPRMTSLKEEGKEKKSTNLFLLSIELIVAASAAMTFGISAISNEFTPFFFGKGFEACINLIIVLSPVLIIKGLSQISRMLYLIPNHMEKIFIESVFAGAIVNLIVNLALIPKMGAMGAVIGTLVAELVSCLWQYLKMNKYIHCLHTILRSLIYVVFGITMFFIIRIVVGLFNGGVIGIAMEVITGVLIYGLLCIAYWKITHNNILNIVISNVKRKK